MKEKKTIMGDEMCGDAECCMREERASIFEKYAG